MNASWIERAKARMKETGIKQAALASALGCTRGAVGHYLAGRRRPTFEQLQIIAEVLDVSPVWLQYGSGPIAIQEYRAAYEGAVVQGIPVRGSTKTGAKGKVTRFLVFTYDRRYALRVEGTDLSPRMYEGEYVLLDPEQEAMSGDEVLVKFSDGTLGIHSLIARQDGEVILEGLLDKQQRFVRPWSAIQYIHTIIGVFHGQAMVRKR